MKFLKDFMNGDETIELRFEENAGGFALSHTMQKHAKPRGLSNK